MKLLLSTAFIFIIATSFLLAAKADATSPRPGNLIGNQTYGQCVSEQAALKNNCYERVKNTRYSCVNATNDTLTSKICNTAYKKDKSDCKKAFKDAKVKCNAIKHTFLETVRYGFS